MSWIQTYLDYTAAQESPEEFHLFGGLTVIASVLNRKCWFSRVTRDGVERYKLFPGQLATVFVAGSGTVRKSTAVEIAHDFMKKAGVRLFDGKISHERLLTKLGSFKDGKAILTVVASELETFLSRSTYHDGLIGSLNKLFDSRDDVYETQKGSSVPLRDISFTVLAATTPSSIGDALPAAAKEQGFQSRWLFVFADRSTKSDPATTDPNDVAPDVIRRSFELKTELISGLKKMDLLRGEFKLTPDAKSWYDDWYEKYAKSEIMEKGGWPARRGDHMTRLAMLLQAADYKLAISKGSLEATNALLEKYVEANFDKTFAYIGRHGSAAQQDKILEVFALYQNGHPVTLSEITFRTRRYFKGPVELRESLDFLKQAGILKFEGLVVSGEEIWKKVKKPT